jgi:hypothetical protein
MLDFSNPLTLLILLPLILSLTGQLIIRFFFGEGLGSILANSAIIIAFIITLMIHTGMKLSLDIITLPEKIFMLLNLSFLLGIFADKFPRSDKISLYSQIALLIAALFWIFIDTVRLPLGQSDLTSLAILTILGVILFHQNNEAKDTELLAAKNLFSFALGLLGVSYLAEIDLINNMIIIYLSSAAGFLIINLFKNRFPFGASAIYPSFILLFLLSSELYNINNNLFIPLLLLSTCFFTQEILHKYSGRFDPIILNFIPVSAGLISAYIFI